VTDEGIEIQWQFGEPERVLTVTLERSESPVGPWVALALGVQHSGRAASVLDQATAPGGTYYYRLIALLSDGTGATFGPISVDAIRSHEFTGITSIAPNPTASATHIDFGVARQEQVLISVLDVAGRETDVLLDEVVTPGTYSLLWDGRRGGTRLPAGVYFVRCQSPGRSMHRRLVLVR